MHRFSDTRKFIQRARAESWPLISISVGVKTEDIGLIEDIAESKCRVDFVTIDIANAFADSVADMIKHIKTNLPNAKVIAGNIWGDKDSVEFLQNAGADCLKIGLSMGSACRTFPETSFGSPMFSAALEAGRWAKVPVILDGGIKENGDIARAMIGFMANQGQHTYGGNRAGKSYPRPLNIPMVMIGGQLAACIDAPGESIYEKFVMEALKSGYSLSDITKNYPINETQVKFKRFYGSASAENKKKTGQVIKHIEGKTVDIPCNGLTYREKYQEIIGAVQSQISYAGGKDLTAFKDVKWMSNLA